MIQEWCRGRSFTVGNKSLLRDIRSRDAAAIVVGTVIGTGVFLKTAVMAQHVGSAQIVLLAWAAAGVLSLMGALTYAEISTLFPATGGEYVYLREAYGELPAFLFGWTRFLIISPGSIAAYAAGTATFLDAMVLLEELRLVVAIAIIVVFSLVNCMAVSVTGRLQTFLTGLKVFMILGLTAAIFALSTSGDWSRLQDGSAPWAGWSAFGAAVLAALWAFDGWSNLPLAGGEIAHPRRALPLALAGGTLMVFLIYAVTNLGYFYALPLEEVMNANSTSFPSALPVATKAGQTALGPLAVHALSLMFVLSALGALNGSILTGARVPYAMAMDGLFFRIWRFVSDGARVPAVSVLAQGTIAIILVALGSFDQLTDYVIFASWIFYALVAASLFIFRRRSIGREQAYQTPFYPYLPAVFIGVSVLLLINTLFTAPKESGLGLLIITAGVPFFFFFRSRRAQR